MALNLERSVDEYIISGIPSKKLLLGLPYYGVEWQTYDLKFPSKVKQFQNFHTYRYIKSLIGNYSCVTDEPSSSKYYAYRDKDNNYRQIWFEDSTTLGIKYDWIKEKQLGGVGIWALGYDNGHTELWKLLAQKFAYTPVITSYSIHYTKLYDSEGDILYITASFLHTILIIELFISATSNELIKQLSLYRFTSIFPI